MLAVVAVRIFSQAKVSSLKLCERQLAVVQGGTKYDHIINNSYFNVYFFPYFIFLLMKHKQNSYI